MCSECKKNRSFVVSRPDPYAMEVMGRYIERNLCEDCYTFLMKELEK